MRNNSTLKRNVRILGLSLIVTSAIFLAACTTVISSAPAYPTAGKKVATELEEQCGKRLEKCPAIKSWLQDLDKFKRELDVK